MNELVCAWRCCSSYAQIVEGQINALHLGGNPGIDPDRTLGFVGPFKLAVGHSLL
jgi:hypothetical protein